MNNTIDARHTASDSTSVQRMRAALHLVRVSLWRMFWSKQTLVSLVVLLFSMLIVFAWTMEHDRSPKDFLRQILLPIYATFLLPVFCLSYATAAIAADREERTLTYLLSIPQPRLLIYLSKFVATLIVVGFWTVGGLTAITAVAGESAWQVFQRVWLAMAVTTIAYVSLFQLFSAMLRHATVVGLCYALFLETCLGNMPGVAKRVAISFYSKCLLFEAGKQFGLDLTRRRHASLFLPVSAKTAWTVLCLLCVLLFAVGAVYFSHREYDD